MVSDAGRSKLALSLGYPAQANQLGHTPRPTVGISFILQALPPARTVGLFSSRLWARFVRRF
jgi:hypothetical protein